VAWLNGKKLLTAQTAAVEQDVNMPADVLRLMLHLGFTCYQDSKDLPSFLLLVLAVSLLLQD
jgi:hypothetical protein